jgi:hypothetical protein
MELGHATLTKCKIENEKYKMQNAGCRFRVIGTAEDVRRPTAKDKSDRNSRILPCPSCANAARIFPILSILLILSQQNLNRPRPAFAEASF